MRRWAFILVATLFALPTLAGGWDIYGNARFAYLLPLPPGFSAVAEADNSDGGTSRSADGRATLAVWGTHLSDTPFRDEVLQRMEDDEGEGWKLSYKKAGNAAASWSGTRDGHVLYMRGIKLCTDAAAFFKLDYPAAEMKAYDAVVKNMVKGFRKDGCGM